MQQKAFREMGQFEEIDLIHSEAVTKSNPRAEEGSLYEAVRAVEPFADSCLKTLSGTDYEMPHGGGAAKRQRRCDAGLLFLQ